MYRRHDSRRWASAARRRRSGHPEELFQTLSLEGLEGRQMLSATVLTPSELVDAAVSYLREHGAEYGLAPSDLESYAVSAQYTTEHLGVHHIYLRQTHQGVEVRDADLNANLRLDGSFVSGGSSFVRGLNDHRQAINPDLTASEGLKALAEHYGWTVDAWPGLEFASTDVTRAGQFTAGDLAVEPIPVQLDYVPLESGGVELAWTYVVRRPMGEGWMHSSVSAFDGRLLAESDWIDHATYKVFDRPIESPIYGGQSEVIDPNDKEASPYAWHDLDGIPGHDTTETRGNNVYAQGDRFGLDSGTGPRAQGGPNLQFLYDYSLGSQPVISLDAAVTNLFYWNNLLHDVHHRYGFNEISGNFQENNYGNGGIGSDSVQADAQYAARLGVRNNAWFATPPEGQNPQMAMLEWDFTYPQLRDSDIENTIIAHEYGHGVSNRLTGGPYNADALNAFQSAGMGEGWSDFWALMFTQEPSDDAGDAYPLGNWVLGDDFLLTSGIRRYPYSFNMNIDPLTFGDLPSSFGVHDAGEIWASALWDMNWLLIDGLSQFDPGLGFDYDLLHGTKGNNVAMQLVADGLKLQPTNPTFLEARDAILLADRLAYGGVHQRAIWTAFARRGMGYSAVANNPNSTTVTEAFDMPSTRKGTVLFNRDVYTTSDTVRIKVRDLDLAGGGDIWVPVTSTGGDSESVMLSETDLGVFEGSIQTRLGAVQAGNGELQVLPGELLTATYADANIGNGQPAVATDKASIEAAPASVEFDAATYDLGDFIEVEVNDVELIGQTSIQVIVESNGGDIEWVTLNVSSNPQRPYEFRGTIASSGGRLYFHDGTLQARVANMLTVTYMDDVGSGNPVPLTDTAVITGGIGSTVYSSTNVPVAISGGPHYSSLTIADVGAIGDVNVRLDITHTWNEDLDVYLIAPNGTRIELFTFVGGSSDNFLGTILDSQAATSITAGTAPFTGTFRPEGNLNLLNGLSRAGTWQLEMTDTFPTADDGTLLAWSLVISDPIEIGFDFGPDVAPVAANFTGVQTAVYDSSLGYGWLPGAVDLGTTMRVDGSVLSRDVAYVRDGTFAIDVPNGAYDVTLFLGDTLQRRDSVSVYIEGTYRESVTTAPGVVATRVYSTVVADGQLSIRLKDLGGSSPLASIAGLVFDRIDNFNVDFGTPTSPVEPGYQRATSALYAAQTGWGWLAGASNLTTKDRGIGTALTRDLALLREGTFVIDVPSNTYDVTITFGDMLNGHDLMGVYLEGSFIEWVTTNPGTTLPRTYTTTVTDGQLTIRFRDLGGANTYVAVVGIDVGPAGSSAKPSEEGSAGGETQTGAPQAPDSSNAFATGDSAAAGALPATPIGRRLAEASAAEPVFDWNAYDIPESTAVGEFALKSRLDERRAWAARID